MIGRPLDEPRTGRPGRGVKGRGTMAPVLIQKHDASLGGAPHLRRRCHAEDRSARSPHEPEVAERLEAMMPPGVEPLALFRTFARNLGMTSAMGP